MNETTKVQHTSGPWEACGADRGGCACRQVWSVSADVIVAVAIDFADEGYGEGPTHERAKANARLIAAAPELLEALHGLMDIESRGRTMPVGPEWDAARAAIAKAEGR